MNEAISAKNDGMTNPIMDQGPGDSSPTSDNEDHLFLTRGIIIIPRIMKLQCYPW